jgi:MATE family multidrug resistance protein
VGQGIIRGLGKQGKASIGTVLGYWVIGIPISLLCVFIFEWGMAGLWTGPVLAILFNFGFYFSLILDKLNDKKEESAWVYIYII